MLGTLPRIMEGVSIISSAPFDRTDMDREADHRSAVEVGFVGDICVQAGNSTSDYVAY